MIKIDFKYGNNTIELAYNENGVLETVRDTSKDNKYFIIQTMFKGVGYEIDFEKSVLGGSFPICDARYARIMELDMFIPRYLFIKKQKR